MAIATSDVLVQQYEDERAQKLQLINNLMGIAAEEKRDLTDHERETIKRSQDRVGVLNGDIELVAKDLTLATEVTDRLRMLSPAFTGGTPMYRSTGQLLYDMLHQADGDCRARYQRHMRAAEHMGTTAAATTPTAGDLAGLITSPVVGTVIDPLPGGMPLAAGVGLIDAPNAISFIRPTLVDANIDTGVGVQALQKAELASKAFEVNATSVTLSTIGGYLNVSQQLLSFQPGSLQIIVNQLNKRLGRKIDAALLAEIDNSTGSVDLPAAATAAQVLQALYDASAEVYAATGQLAEWIAMGPLGWARLGGLADTAGRPLFPFIGAANAAGTSGGADVFAIGPAGLRPIVTPAITDATFWVGNSSVVEGYMYRYPVLEAVEPSVLGRQVAVAVGFAAFTPIANSAVHVFDAP